MSKALDSVWMVLNIIISSIAKIWKKILEQIHIARLGAKFPGRRPLPILGNVLELGHDSEAVAKYIEQDYYRFGKLFRICVGPFTAIVTGHLEDNEEFLSGTEYLKKGILYEFLKPWLGTGLLISTGDKWRRRRKILTPAFHFKILDQFIHVFNSCGDEFIRQLRKKTGKEAFDVWPPTKLLTLDVICGLRRRVAFLDLLLLAARDGSLTDADIREEVDTFMFEGHDTTAAAISFTLYELSKREDVQDKLLEELENVFGSSSHLEPNHQQLSELKYMEMVIKESMRIYPPVPAVSREITKDYKLPASGLVVPKGSELFACLIALHRDEQVFPDPETFDPEHFSPEKCARRHPFAYLPFSAGPRNCIGQKFVMLEMKAILAKVIWNFHIRPDPTFTPILTWELILKTKNGLFVKIEERKKNNSN